MGGQWYGTALQSKTVAAASKIRSGALVEHMHSYVVLQRRAQDKLQCPAERAN